jgi:hypothetical protein
MKRLFTVSLVWFFLGISLIAQSVKVVSFPQFVSNSLVVFSKYVNWPINHKNGDFVITIIGDQSVYKELSNTSQNMTVGAQNITVRYFSKISELEGFSHIVFLSENSSGNFRKLLEKIGADNTLLVTSSDGLLLSGAGINFIPIDGLMKFEVSKNNINKRNLQIHSWLEKMSAKS